jgi:hypothetical protein
MHGRAMIGVAALLALGACQQRAADSAGWPQVAATPVAAFGPPNGRAALPVRAVVREGEVARAVPAVCRVAAERFDAEFASPAVVAVPTWDRQSSPVQVACEAEGRRGAAVARPVVQRTDGLMGLPALGMGVTSGGDSFVTLGGWWNRGQPPTVFYPSVDVVLQ